MITRLSDATYVINDGYLSGAELNALVIPATRGLFGKKLKSGSLPISIANFLLAQTLLGFGLLRCIRKVDIVILFPITMVLPALISRLAGKRLVLYEAQDILDQRLSQRRLVRLEYLAMLILRFCVLSLARHIIVEGPSVPRLSGIESYSRKILVCPQYVDQVRFRVKTPLRDRPVIVGFVGALDFRKGALEFAQAVRILAKDPDLSFLIVGAGPLASAIDLVLGDLRESGKVELKTFVTNEEMPDLFNKLRLCVMPSISEGLPNTLLEAMACGTPVLATPVGAVADVLEDGNTGFILPFNSPAMVADHVVRSLNAPGRELVSENARNLVEKSYTYEAALQRYQEMFAAVERSNLKR